MNNEPTHLDLFSGIGGFALAARWAGFRTVGFCEIDPYAQRVLTKNFLADADDGRFEECERILPNGGESKGRNSNGCNPQIYPDIRTLNGTQFRGVDLITGGFPCQPFSCAGKRRGKEDDRHLWPEMLRVISEARPAWVLGENVAGIINMELDTVLSDLESIGYACRPFVIPACGVDARHRRNRVWVVANRSSNGSTTGLSEQEQRQEGQPEVAHDGCRRNNVANATGEQGSSGDNRGESRSTSIPGEGKSGRSDCGSMRTSHWLPEPDVGRVVDGLSLELDFARQITAHEKSNRSEKKPARNLLVWKFLRAVWEHREIATTSPELYVCALQDSVPEVPFRDSQSRWLLGARIKEEPGLRDMWRDFYAAGLASAQDMQFKLLERARTAKRGKTMGNRVDRLRGLGNAIVPQVAFQILKAIREIDERMMAAGCDSE